MTLAKKRSHYITVHQLNTMNQNLLKKMIYTNNVSLSLSKTFIKINFDKLNMTIGLGINYKNNYTQRVI